MMHISAGLPVSATTMVLPGTSVCAGTQVTFSVNILNGGTLPLHQWYLNGNPVGTDSSGYTMTPANGDLIYCKVTSSLTCASNNPALSNTVTMSIVSSLPVTASINALPGTTVCAGTTVTDSASVINGGSNPLFQWYLNGIIAGGNNPVYSHIPAQGDVVYCKVTSDLGCATNNPATSNSITINVSAAIPVNVTLSALPGVAVCNGTPVNFTAHPVNEGTLPIFQWYVNGSTAGSNSPDFTITPINGDKVYCILTSDISCASNNPATSDTATIAASDPDTTKVTITSDRTSVCPGQIVNFIAHPVNEGTHPDYEWMIDGTPVLSDSLVHFTLDSIMGSHSVTCKLRSSAACLLSNPVFSLPIIITAHNAPIVNLSDQPSLCAEPSLQLDAGPGFSAYLWQNGSSVQKINASNSGLYFVTVTDGNGCTGSDTLLVKDCPTQLFIPNAFSPNGDGTNDQFRILINPDLINQFRMSIYNRWGEMVFESRDITIGWEGQSKDSPAGPGTYVYLITYSTKSANGLASEEKTFKGTVVLVR